MKDIFKEVIDTVDPTGDVGYYGIEDLYQDFKKRLIAELSLSSPELLNGAELNDKAMFEILDLLKNAHEG